ARRHGAFWRSEANVPPLEVVPARGTPRRSRRGDPVAGTHDHRPVVMGPGSPLRFGRDDGWLVRAKNRPAVAGSDRRLRSIVCGLLFPMNGTTKTREPSAQRATQPAAAPLARFSTSAGAGESKAMSARLMVAWRVAEVIFAPNRSVM